MINLGAKLNESNDDHVRAELARLPEALDQVDHWIEEGVLDGEQLNAADYQIAPSIRLLMTFDDLRPAIQGRPGGRLAERALPEEMGRVPAIFPQAWVTLKSPAAA
jgi:glutathione S-transferase